MHPQPSSDDLIRLEAKTIKDVCWLWQGSKSGDGYGRIRFMGRLVGTHRLSAAIYLGYNIFDETYQVLHNAECPNRHCWNPDHLHIGTNVDNHAERQPKSHCVNGHEFTPDNTFINPRGRKECRTCRRNATQHYKRQLAEAIRKYNDTTKF